MAPQGEDSEETVQSSEVIQDGTLKYHLLGPSLTKAGQDAVDQRKVSEQPCEYLAKLMNGK